MMENQTMKGMKILIADDSKFSRIMMGRIFSEFGFEVDEVENGVQALELYLKNLYDVVVLDVEMPDLNGPETLKKMRETDGQKYSNSLVMAITAHNDARVLEKLKESGFDDVIRKPFNIDDLHLKLKQLLFEKRKEKLPFPHLQEHPESERLYDLKLLEEYSDGDDQFQEQILRHFITDSLEVVDVLNQDLNDGHWDDMRRKAHKYGSDLGFMGVGNLSDECRKIEINALNEESRADMPALIKRFSNLVIQVVNQIQADFKL